jgi:hypothetical protein
VLSSAVAIALVAIPCPTPALAGEIDLGPYLNNVGITQDLSSGANFDGDGWSYSALSLRLGDPQNGYPGVAPGDRVTVDGFMFTWPNRPSGAPDNVLAESQTIPLPSGATRIGFLGASNHGPATGTFTFNYTYIDQSGIARQKALPAKLTFSDWTLNAGASPPSQGNVVVLRALFRTAGPQPQLDAPHVFLVSASLDPTMTLVSVTLPPPDQETGLGKIHLFGIALA